jgi:hypothetical protein
VRTQRPTLRITRWQRSWKKRIPFERGVQCSNAKFKIKYKKRSELTSGMALSVYLLYAPADRDRYMGILQRKFDEHLKSMHPEYAEMQKTLSLGK